MSAITQPALTGITAQAASASVQVTSGASRNTPLLAPAGMTSSLNTNFSRSAKDCSSPNGPTTFGPRRICTAAQILRSAQQHIGDRDQQDDEQQQRLRHDHDQRPEIVLVQNSAKVMALLRRRHGRAAFGERRAFGHHRGRARDRVGEVEVLDRRSGTAPCPASPPTRESWRMSAGPPGTIWPMRAEMRMRLEQRLRAARASESIGQLRAEHVGQRAQDRPVLARVAGREARAVGHLHAAFGVDVDAGLLRYRPRPAGSRRRGARRRRRGCRCRPRRRRAARRSRRRRAGTARRARRPCAIVGGGEPALARHEADVERADARGRGVQHARSRSSPPSPRRARSRPWPRARRPPRRPAAPARRRRR